MFNLAGVTLPTSSAAKNRANVSINSDNTHSEETAEALVTNTDK